MPMELSGVGNSHPSFPWASQRYLDMGCAMANDKSRLPASAEESAALGPLGRRSDAGFDRWLGGQLRKLYDDVLDEDVPEYLVEVVRAFDEEPKNEGDDASGDNSRHEPAGRRSRRETAG
jgi:hypothetical protein